MASQKQEPKFVELNDMYKLLLSEDAESLAEEFINSENVIKCCCDC